MNCIIVHGLNIVKGFNQNELDWIPWIKKELEKREIDCDTPLMPRSWNPNYDEWKEEFEKLDIGENSILIGHSAGGAFLVRWLGETKQRIKKLILVAPAKVIDDFNGRLEIFYDFNVDDSIKNRVGEIVIFFSDTERKGIKEAVKLYSHMFEIVPIELKNKGHFIENHMGTKEFPELLNEIFK
ncbi:MAG: alpha/beta hydrolase [archaeon]